MEDSITILMADDEPFILDALRRIFIDSGYTILTAVSGEEVVHNLLGNAIKFGNGGGVAAIRVRPLPASDFTIQDRNGSGPDYVEVAIEDSGIGIRPEDISRLCSFFTQLESPFTKRFVGIGVGLVLAKKID
jgi:signal transduction histidine kinase